MAASSACRLWRSQFGQLGIPAGHQLFAREVGMRQGTQVALIEEAELDVAVRHEGANGPGLERGEPVHAGEALQRGDLRLRDHPPVAHHHERFHPKSLADPLDLGHQRRRIAVLPLNTETATGQPRASVSNP